MAVDVARLLSSVDTLRPPDADMASLREHYANFRCAQIPQLCDVSELRAAARCAYEDLRSDPVREVQEHAYQNGRLGYGFRVGRLDSKSESAEHSARVTAVFGKYGLTEWAHRMADTTIPIVNEITGDEVEFGRLFVLFYREGDYIGPHGAEEDFEDYRFNLQLPLCYEAVGCMRVLKRGFLEPMYDRDGDARLLGPHMWHEVPPLLRLPGGADPLRLVVSLRLNLAVA